MNEPIETPSGTPPADISSPDTAPDTAADGTVPERGSTPGTRLMVGGLLLALAGLVALAGVAFLRERSDFCDRIAALPSMTTSLDTDGSPGGGLVAYADALDQIADDEKDPATAAAARAVAAEQRALGAAVGGAATSEDVVDQVAQLDSDASADAHERLDAAIERRCG